MGLEEAILDGKAGILFPKDNLEEFSRAIKLLVNNKELRRRLGNYARETTREFTWESIAARREDFFYRVIDDFRQEHPAPKSHQRR